MGGIPRSLITHLDRLWTVTVENDRKSEQVHEKPYAQVSAMIQESAQVGRMSRPVRREM